MWDLHEQYRIHLMESKPTLLDHGLVRLAVGVSMPSGNHQVLGARRLLRECLHGLGASLPGFASSGPVVLHRSTTNSFTYVGEVRHVSDISLYTCPICPADYCPGGARDYLRHRADLHEFIYNLRGRRLVCNCCRDRGSCWAWILHDMYYDIFVGADVTVHSDSGESSGASDCELDPRSREIVSGGLQARRGKFPQLIPDGLTPQQHLCRALCTEHPYKTVSPSTPMVRLALEKSRIPASELINARAKVTGAVKSLAAATSAEDHRIRQLAHPSVRRVLEAYMPKNIAFVREIGMACACYDDEAALRMFVGIPMLGWAPDAKGLMRRRKPPSTSIDEWLSECGRQNQRLLKGIHSLATLCWIPFPSKRRSMR